MEETNSNGIKIDLKFDRLDNVEPMLNMISGIIGQQVNSLHQLDNGRIFARLINIYEQALTGDQKFYNVNLRTKDDDWVKEAVHDWITEYFDISYDFVNDSENVNCFVALLILYVFFEMKKNLPANIKIVMELGWSWLVEFNSLLDYWIKQSKLFDVLENRVEMLVNQINAIKRIKEEKEKEARKLGNQVYNEAETSKKLKTFDQREMLKQKIQLQTGLRQHKFEHFLEIPSVSDPNPSDEDCYQPTFYSADESQATSPPILSPVYPIVFPVQNGMKREFESSRNTLLKELLLKQDKTNPTEKISSFQKFRTGQYQSQQSLSSSCTNSDNSSEQTSTSNSASPCLTSSFNSASHCMTTSTFNTASKYIKTSTPNNAKSTKIDYVFDDGASSINGPLKNTKCKYILSDNDSE